jgi:hypothetical protein
MNYLEQFPNLKLWLLVGKVTDNMRIVSSVDNVILVIKLRFTVIYLYISHVWSLDALWT